MIRLELFLYVKIAFTLATCVGPMLFLPRERVARLFGIDAGSVGVVRLYGIALSALLVGYGSGVPAVRHGAFPLGIVLMGMVSNLGASGFLFASGSWRRAPALAVAFGVIGLGLTWSLLSPHAWLLPLRGA